MRQSTEDQNILIIEDSQSHSDKHKHTHTHTHTHTLGRTPLDERSARRRDFYLASHNTQKRQTSIPPSGFEPAIPGSEGPQTHALNREATGMGN